MLNIRPATPNDTPEILQFIRELAEYEKALPQGVAGPARRALSVPKPGALSWENR